MVKTELLCSDGHKEDVGATWVQQLIEASVWEVNSFWSGEHGNETVKLKVPGVICHRRGNEILKETGIPFMRSAPTRESTSFNFNPIAFTESRIIQPYIELDPPT